MRRLSFSLIILFLFAVPSFAKSVIAVHSTGKIVLDGKLTEEVWKRAGFTEFYQRIPEEGKPATEKMETWVAYDDEALYIAARMYDPHPDSIVGRLTRRDGWAGSDIFYCELDPYHDKRTGYFFGVSACGAYNDGTYNNDEWGDDSWDGIWEAKAHIDSLGWTAEIRIPFSQLRFHNTDVQTWGINFERFLSRKNENSFAAYTPRNESGFVSRFMDLEGLKDIPHASRVEILPYVTFKADYLHPDEGDPFHDRANYLPGAGADFKVGIGNDLNLDGTINPDFGQVEVDPAVINLSDAETFFQEKRPFFIEGSNIFRFGNGGANDFENFGWFDPGFFYSRRIGRSPQGELPAYDYADIPIAAHIIGAAKLTGDLGNNTPLGVISAVTKREYADISSGGVHSSAEVEPLTAYNVIRARKEFDGSFWSIGAFGSNAYRSFTDPALASQINKTGSALALDGWSFLDRDRVWVVTGWAGMTNLTGTKEALTLVQENSRHYFQRPDATKNYFDSNATSLTGYGARFWLNKNQGNVMFNGGLGFLGPGYDQNDLGLSYHADIINGHVMLGYKWTQPAGIMRFANFWGVVGRSYDFEGNPTDRSYALGGYFQSSGYYDFRGFVSLPASHISTTLTRGGPVALMPRTEYAEFAFSSDQRLSLAYDGGTWIGTTSLGHIAWSVTGGLSWKANDNLDVRFSPNFTHSRNDEQYLAAVTDANAHTTYGTRYIFGELDQQTLSATIRANWTFTPALSFQLYLQPFISVGTYTNIKEFAKPGTFDFNRYGIDTGTISLTDGVYTIDPDGAGSSPAFTMSDPNFHYSSVRGNAVLRWEYLPGSTIYFVWQHTQAQDDAYTNLDPARDLSSLFSANAENIFLIKVNYWLNI
jgi:hypothetical protein